jgi:hypothetical protein
VHAGRASTDADARVEHTLGLQRGDVIESTPPAGEYLLLPESPPYESHSICLD